MGRKAKKEGIYVYYIYREKERVKKRGYITDSLCYAAETNNIVKQLCTHQNW